MHTSCLCCCLNPPTDIRTALKAKDEEYVKLLKRQAADVDAMLSTMGQQLGQMTAAYREELQNVEGVLLQVRTKHRGGAGCVSAQLFECSLAPESGCAPSVPPSLNPIQLALSGALRLPALPLFVACCCCARCPPSPHTQERAELLASNRKEVGSLLEARAAAESNFTDKYLAAVETYAQNLEQLRHADAEEYQVLKIK